MKKESYVSGIELSQFEHIPSISSYNHNFYKGFGKDLLLVVSNDDNLSDWFLLEGKNFVHIGESFTSEGEIFWPFSRSSTSLENQEKEDLRIFSEREAEFEKKPIEGKISSFFYDEDGNIVPKIEKS